MIGIGPTAGRGRGVFAWTLIAEGALIEEAPVVVLPAEQVEHVHRTVLDEYYFKWGPGWKEAAVLLGTC